MTGRERVGVLGGTFDPPHIGHLVLGLNALEELSLTRVLLVVSNISWQKVDARRVTPAHVRYHLVSAAVGGHPGLEASDLELRIGGESSTVNTLTVLRACQPEVDPVLILGADAAAGIPTWRNWERLADLADLAVGVRIGAAAEGVLPFWPREVARIGLPRLDVSSSYLRDRVAQGRRIDFLVPSAVSVLVERLRLYR